MPIFYIFCIMFALLIEKSEETTGVAFTRKGGYGNAEQKRD